MKEEKDYYTEKLENEIRSRLIYLKRFKKSFLITADERAFITDKFSEEIHNFCKENRISNEHLKCGTIRFVKLEEI